MKTPFSAFAAFAALLLLAPSALLADNAAGDAFSRCRDAVLGSGVFSAEGYLFCAGRAVSAGGLGEAAGYEKARSLALGKALDWMRDGAPWPNDATAKERRAAWVRLMGKGKEIRARGSCVVFRKKPAEDCFVVVVAFPLEGLSATMPDCGELARLVAEVRRCANEATGKPPADFALEAPHGGVAKGCHEKDGIMVNETLSEEDFL